MVTEEILQNGAMITAGAAMSAALLKFVQWLVTTALNAAEGSNDRLEKELLRATEQNEALHKRVTELEDRVDRLANENSELLLKLQFIEIRSGDTTHNHPE